LNKYKDKKSKEDDSYEGIFNKENQGTPKCLEKSQKSKFKKPHISEIGKSHSDISFEINPYNSSEFDNELQNLDRL
jgi:hypothetical protein